MARFFLDECVDAGVCKTIRKRRHECWTVPEAGRSERPDDENSVYADDKDAIIVSHDREFKDRRMARTFGRHVFLACRHTEAVGVITQWLDDLITLIDQRGEGIYILNENGPTFARGHPL